MAAERRKSAGSFFYPGMLLCMAVILIGWPLSAVGRQISSPDQNNGAGLSRQVQFSGNDPFQAPSDAGKMAAGSIDGPMESDAARSEDCLPPPQKGKKPRIAIIIDDMGNHRHIDEQLLVLDLNLTFAFLPYAPFTQELEEKAWAGGHDILVHMPMEPRDPQWDPGPDALYVDDSLERITFAVEKNLALVPHATGVNNHMGSLFTGNRSAMRRFLVLLRQKGMFFVDSITSAESVGMAVAKELGVLSAQRQVFLDNIQNQKDICRQLKELVRIAREKGRAIGIGHAGETTLRTLAHCRESLLENVSLVGIHELVN